MERGEDSWLKQTHSFSMLKTKVLGRLASHVASTLLVTRREGDPKRVIIINAEKAIVTGAKDKNPS